MKTVYFTKAGKSTKPKSDQKLKEKRNEHVQLASLQYELSGWMGVDGKENLTDHPGLYKSLF